jgi:Flp pilus assembly protein TadG
MKRPAKHAKRTLTSLAIQNEEGGSLVEMAFSCLALIPILFGIIELSLGLYCYHFAANAAREATRWAIVRGSTCNVIFGNGYCSPTSATGNGADGADIAQYVNALGYPFSSNATTVTKWCTKSSGASAAWTSCSTTQNNAPGNQVQVTVTYVYPLVIPFVPRTSLNLSSVSSMTIVQ